MFGDYLDDCCDLYCTGSLESYIIVSSIIGDCVRLALAYNVGLSGLLELLQNLLCIGLISI